MSHSILSNACVIILYLLKIAQYDKVYCTRNCLRYKGLFTRNCLHYEALFTRNCLRYKALFTRNCLRYKALFTRNCLRYVTALFGVHTKILENEIFIWKYPMFDFCDNFPLNNSRYKCKKHQCYILVCILMYVHWQNCYWKEITYF